MNKLMLKMAWHAIKYELLYKPFRRVMVIDGEKHKQYGSTRLVCATALEQWGSPATIVVKDASYKVPVIGVCYDLVNPDQLPPYHKPRVIALDDMDRWSRGRFESKVVFDNSCTIDDYRTAKAKYQNIRFLGGIVQK